jgi:hypothetical protein
MGRKAATLFIVSIAFGALAFTAAPARADSSGCIAHRPLYIEGSFEVRYDAGCSGHDEPELDPVSSAPGSARDLTWTIVLPTDGSSPVSATGPTFWFGGTVTDPTSLFGQAFVELQFYPDALVTNCTPNGGFVVKNVPNAYTACSPVWKLTQTGTPGVFHETAAFNAMLTDSGSPGMPLVMTAGDTVTIHWYVTPEQDGFHVTVTDVTTQHSGTIVLNSKSDGPLMPAFDTQRIGNALGWGIVDDTPNSFVWEIGHTSPFTSPADQFCVPGESICDSYNADSWASTLPIQIKSVTFGDGSTAKKWAAVSDFGGKAEVNQYCSAYGGPFCIYPWFTLGASGYHYGVDFPDTVSDFGQADQFQQTRNCSGPFGPNSTYCVTILK